MPEEQQPEAGSRRPQRMVIVLWDEMDCNRWQAEADRMLAGWPEQLGRRCPNCGAEALVGHGRRPRSVHARAAVGGRTCEVEWFEAQRVRCTACGRTDTLLPGFVARCQRHPNRVRQQAVEVREGGGTWAEVVRACQALGVPLVTATSARRWVAGVRERMAAAVEGLRGCRGSVPDGAPAYGSVERPGTWAACADLVRHLRFGAWPDDETLAGANRLARGRWAL